MSSEKPINADDSEERTPEQIEAEIETKRDELGDTVAALADKADVKKQARKKAGELKEQAAAKVDEVKEQAGIKAEEFKESAPQASAPFRGSAGDIGSGPTGDITPGPGDVNPRNPLVIAAAALVLGFVAGRLSNR